MNWIENENLIRIECFFADDEGLCGGKRGPKPEDEHVEFYGPHGSNMEIA